MNHDAGTKRVPFDRLTLVRFVRTVRMFATSHMGSKALSLFALLVALLVAINGLNVVNSFVGRDFMTAIAERSMSRFVWQAVVYVAVFALSTLVAVFYRFAEERLGLLWREWLSHRLMMLYLDNFSYLRLGDALAANGEVANPDQRITEDVRAFTTTTLSFILLILNGSFTVLAFSGVLWSISPLLFCVAVAYATMGSILTVLLGRPLVRLNYAQFDKEANFRSELIHVRDNAEALALARHEGPLRNEMSRRIDELTANLRRIIAVNRNLGFFTTGYNYLIQIIPALVVAPLFIHGKAEFGVIPQSAMAFSQLLGAFSLIVTQFQSISSFAAVIARLGSLAEGLERASSVAILSRETCEHRNLTVECPLCLKNPWLEKPGPRIVVREEAGRLAYDGLTLRSPQDGRILVRDLSVSIPHGTRTLLAGPNDDAKLALLRATAGMWDAGEGRLVRPPAGRVKFVSERPYLPPLTLREVLLPSRPVAPVTDEDVAGALRAFGLEPLVERIGGLNAHQDWRSALSLGEQQGLVFARILLARPDFVFLDRISTVFELDQVRTILRILSERSVTWITIGQFDGILDFHDAVLELNDDGSWQWKPLRQGGPGT